MFHGRHHLFILDGHDVVAVDDVLEWAEWFEQRDERRIVRQDKVGDVLVSTVFLGIDMNFGFAETPLIFETMVFGGELDKEQHRSSRWDEAEHVHRRMLARVQERAG